MNAAIKRMCGISLIDRYMRESLEPIARQFMTLREIFTTFIKKITLQINCLINNRNHSQFYVHLTDLKSWQNTSKPLPHLSPLFVGVKI